MGTNRVKRDSERISEGCLYGQLEAIQIDTLVWCILLYRRIKNIEYLPYKHTLVDRSHRPTIFISEFSVSPANLHESSLLFAHILASICAKILFLISLTFVATTSLLIILFGNKARLQGIITPPPIFTMNKLLLFFLFALALCAHANKLEYDIFDAIKNDEVDAIRTFVEKDPATLESIYGGGQKGITVYRSGRTPLLYAVLEGKSQAVKTLLELGADVHATEQDGYNVLHAAGTQGRAEVLEILMDHFSENSIDMNITTDQHADGFYPLHVSFSNYNRYELLVFR